jgi:peroxiredoxin
MRAHLLISFVLALLLLTTLNFRSAGQQGPVILTPAPTPSPTPLASLPASVLDAKLQSADGRWFKLTDYAGKVLVLNLWATWVGPSRMETPELVKLQTHFWSQGVRVVGLSTEDPYQSADEVHAWVRSFGVQYRIGWAPSEVAITLMQGREVLPQTFVISRTGRIVKRFIGFNPAKTPAQFKEAVEEALNETPQ